VVEHGGFRRLGGARVVVARHSVQQLGSRRRRELAGTGLDQPRPEMDVTEQPSFGGLTKSWARNQLGGSPDVVQKRCGEQQVGSETRMQLAELAADRRDPDRVLEQAAGIVVVAIGRSRQRPHPAPDFRVADDSGDRSAQWGIGDLGDQVVQKSLELVGVAAHSRREVGRILVRCRLDRADVELQPVPVSLDPSEHAHRVAFAEPAVEEVDVVPDASFDSAARVDELEREVRGAASRPQPALACDREDALHDPVLRQLGDRAHSRSLGSKAAARVRAVADVKPFRALRYDERRAGPLSDLVAPPYDVISAEARERYLARSPYNVVHVTLPDDEADAGRALADWEAAGVLARESEPSLWWLAQDYVGPDGIPRRRDGLVGALRVEPYETGAVLPHERTHAGPKEGRLRLLRATRTHVEPIFLLYEGRLEGPAGERLVDVELDGVRSRLWRFEGEVPAALSDTPLVIADGHHRYETALAFHGEDGSEATARMPVVIVPTRQDGLTIFPTHRIAARTKPLPPLDASSNGDDRAVAEVYTRSGSGYLRGNPGELDVDLVARYAADVGYTPSADEARAAVDAGQAEAAFLLRPPTVEQVASAAKAGRTMPQKSTFFYPKLTSGLFFLPLD
jgi:uncharacterized protein (DUF1015 family)